TDIPDPVAVSSSLAQASTSNSLNPSVPIPDMDMPTSLAATNGSNSNSTAGGQQLMPDTNVSSVAAIIVIACIIVLAVFAGATRWYLNTRQAGGGRIDKRRNSTYRTVNGVLGAVRFRPPSSSSRSSSIMSSRASSALGMASSRASSVLGLPSVRASSPLAISWAGGSPRSSRTGQPQRGSAPSSRPESLWNANRRSKRVSKRVSKALPDLPPPTPPKHLSISVAPPVPTKDDDEEQSFMPTTPLGMTWEALPELDVIVEGDEDSDSVEEGWGYTQKGRPNESDKDGEEIGTLGKVRATLTRIGRVTRLTRGSSGRIVGTR
ncbi:hypothetical protein HK101_003039, partial [Irineochytrium annulatum]